MEVKKERKLKTKTGMRSKKRRSWSPLDDYHFHYRSSSLAFVDLEPQGLVKM